MEQRLEFVRVAEQVAGPGGTQLVGGAKPPEHAHGHHAGGPGGVHVRGGVTEIEHLGRLEAEFSGNGQRRGGVRLFRHPGPLAVERGKGPAGQELFDAQPGEGVGLVESTASR